jgi:phosphotriesterase-related protein
MALERTLTRKATRMERSNKNGDVQTVLGRISPDELGITLPHEHLLLDMSYYFVEPTEVRQKNMAYSPVCMELASWLRVHRLQNLDNLKLESEETAIREALLFKHAGGNSIVELSNIGMSRNPEGLVRISQATDLHIIMGSGYYIDISHPEDLIRKTEEQIAREIIHDIVDGVRDTGIRAGIIGEIGCSVPLTESERKVLRASAIAQRCTGAALNVHPSKNDDIVSEIVDIIQNAGGDLSRTIISHVSYSCFQMETLFKLAERGCLLEIDNFGRPVVPFDFYIFKRHQDAPSDADRIKTVKELIENGYLNRILISTDNCLKHNLTSYGGNGYAYILDTIIPWMKTKGIENKDIQQILVENPKRVLTFVSPA